MFAFSLPAAVLAASLLPLAAAAAPLSLQQALELAQQRSEAVRSARAGAAGAAEAARRAGQLPDPMLSLGLENLPVTGGDRFSTSREGMTMKRIGVAQEWVPEHKRRLRTGAALAVVAREAGTAATAAAATRLQAALAFVDAHYAAERLRWSVAAEANAREAGAVARAALAAATGSAQEALALSATLGQVSDEVAEARQQAAAASVNLARWTGAPAEELAAPLVPAAAAEQAYVDAHPMVVSRQRDIVVARAEAAAVAAERRPNWTWEVAYGQRSGSSDLVSVGVRIPLPVAPGARQDRDTAARLAAVEQAEADAAEAARAAQAEHRTLTGDAQRLQDRLRSYEAGVLAPAAQRVAAARAAYAANQASLATVFEARRAELEARRRLVDLQREFARVRVQLAFRPVRAEELQ